MNIPLQAPRRVTLQGIKHIRFTLSAVRAKAEFIKSSMSDDGFGYMVTPDGLDENDLSILRSVIRTLEDALK